MSWPAVTSAVALIGLLLGIWKYLFNHVAHVRADILDALDKHATLEQDMFHEIREDLRELRAYVMRMPAP